MAAATAKRTSNGAIASSGQGEVAGGVSHVPGAVLPGGELFEGMALAGMTGREIAAAARVSPPQVTKWRYGRARLSGEMEMFLTLVLAHRIDQLSGSVDEGNAEEMAGLLAARDALSRQEATNLFLGAQARLDGMRRFRHWLAAREPAA